MTKGTFWNQVPFSPAGLSPAFFHCAATYSAVRKFPFEPGSRPPMESSAMMNRLVRRFSGVMTDGFGAWDDTGDAATIVAARSSTLRRRLFKGTP